MDEFDELYNSYQLGIEKLEDELIYHYTSPEALKSILDNQEIWFSDRIFLNDASEGEYIKELILEEKEFIVNKLNLEKLDFEKRLKNLDINYAHGQYDTYILSFSLDEDNLALWNYYTKNNRVQGYNLGIKTDYFIESLKYKTEDESIHNEVTVSHGKVIYDKVRQLDEIRKIIYHFEPFVKKNKNGNIYFNSILKKLEHTGRFFKRKEFELENEYRITILKRIEHPIFTKRETNKEVEFRIKEGYFIPYIPFEFDLNSIESIGISPTVNVELANRGLYKLLCKYKMKTKINYSKIPIRY